MNNSKIIEARKQIDKENTIMSKTSKEWIYESKYRGYPIMIRRQKQYGYLCGYIKTKVLEDSSEYHIMDNHFHGGITFHKDEWIGFDCMHSNDFSPLQYDELSFYEEISLDGRDEVERNMIKNLQAYFRDSLKGLEDKSYCTLEEVKQCLESTIDALIDKK